MQALRAHIICIDCFNCDLNFNCCCRKTIYLASSSEIAVSSAVSRAICRASIFINNDERTQWELLVEARKTRSSAHHPCLHVRKNAFCALNTLNLLVM